MNTLRWYGCARSLSPLQDLRFWGKRRGESKRWGVGALARQGLAPIDKSITPWDYLGGKERSLGVLQIAIVSFNPEALERNLLLAALF